MDERLGLTISPAQVRLQPLPSDGYSWSATGTSAALLEKNISSGNIWFYKSICEQLGRSLEAVPVQVLKGNGKDRLSEACPVFPASLALLLTRQDPGLCRKVGL
jgi:hypothetical protein